MIGAGRQRGHALQGDFEFSRILRFFIKRANSDRLIDAVRRNHAAEPVFRVAIQQTREVDTALLALDSEPEALGAVGRRFCGDEWNSATGLSAGDKPIGPFAGIG